CDRIRQHGYPCEIHKVTTSDGYILTIFRIPNTKSENPMRFPALLMQCLSCTSDIYVVTGPNDGLAFLLASAGFDVWLGNSRGNNYSQQHVSLSPYSLEYWSFALDEVASIDVPTKIRYILKATNRTRLHYYGHSLGATVFLMLLSSDPSYTEIIQSTHLSAPPIFLCLRRTYLESILLQFIGEPGNAAVELIGSFPSQGFTSLVRYLGHRFCKVKQNHRVCREIVNFLSEWGTAYLNTTLLADLSLSIPADGSLRQYIHYLQFAKNCEFKAYDFGRKVNIRKYGTAKPPSYDLKAIHTAQPIEVYFSDNDNMASLENVKKLYSIMGRVCNWNRLKLRRYSHYDFTLATNVGEVVNRCLVAKLQKYEGHPLDAERSVHVVNSVAADLVADIFIFLRWKKLTRSAM
ncbi:lipase 3-like, partial [Musca vetustissima]|uniref:lipase 3-like n=1 Tax=Musca vetustissima TaxID=27455 RepID=UPI002AB7A74A